jgi:hypothetical protein
MATGDPIGRSLSLDDILSSPRINPGSGFIKQNCNNSKAKQFQPLDGGRSESCAEIRII